MIVKHGPNIGQRYEIDGELVVGRENAGLTIEDSEMSRMHAVIRPRGGALEIEDLGSLNGTFVNGAKIEGATRISGGDTIKFGTTTLEVESVPGRASDTAPSAQAPAETVAAPRAAEPAPQRPAGQPREKPTEAFGAFVDPSSRNRKWWTLAAVTASLFMVMVDTTIVNVALPAIQQDLRIDIVELEWTINAFLLVYAALLLTGGTLADFLGRRRLFLFGLAVFTVASVACGLAETGGILIGSRAVQGLGAALMLPATQGLIAANFARHERGMAYGIWAGVSMLGLSLGPLIGGLLIDGLDWRWIFYVNLPFGAVAFAFAAVVLRESKDTSADQHLDVAGLLASGLALFALVFGLVEGNNYGWTSITIVVTFAIAALAFAAFIALELRQRSPMLDLSLFRDGTFAGANVTALLIMLALLGVLFFVSIYLQAVLGFSATKAGATFLPMTLLLMAVAPMAGKLSDRIGPRWPIAGGMTLVGISLLLLSRLDLESGFWDMVPGLVLGGIGLGLAMPPGTTTAIGSLPVDKAGVGSGVVNTFRQTGGALGVAIMGAILVSNLGDLKPGDPEFAGAFIPGFQDALVLGGLIALAGAAIGAATIRKPVVSDEPVFIMGDQPTTTQGGRP